MTSALPSSSKSLLHRTIGTSMPSILATGYTKHIANVLNNDSLRISHSRLISLKFRKNS
ncbi:hypothetical protein OESDEN_16493 [Oesophagostomum dentatum]|uniref:Uncharacterized protein n=1 Tax=Oesophagostomum dentatum TaxID=61180 RepID=A0A0B1SEQ8_OESDE|nr:hypothetical protein OESDEN_16493 [Oesophagostomum dentatum]